MASTVSPGSRLPWVQWFLVAHSVQAVQHPVIFLGDPSPGLYLCQSSPSSHLLFIRHTMMLTCIEFIVSLKPLLLLLVLLSLLRQKAGTPNSAY